MIEKGSVARPVPFCFIDFDGNSVEILREDIAVDEVERA